MPVERVSITIAPDTLAIITARDPGNRSAGIAHVVSRYAGLINRIHRDLKTRFSAAECGLILDALNGSYLRDDVNVMLLHASVEDSIVMDHLDRKWSVDGHALMLKLRECTAPDLYGIADAVEIWWNRVSAGEQPPYSELFTPPAAPSPYLLEPDE